MKAIIFILLTLFFLIKINAQQDSIYIKNLFDKAYNYEKSNPDSALILYDDIIAIARKNKHYFSQANANTYKGIVYSDKAKYDSAIVYYKKGMLGFEKINNQAGIAKNIFNIGNVYKYKGDFSKAISNYLKAISIFEKLEDNFKLSISYGNLGTIFDDIKQYDDAKKNYIKSNIFAKKSNNTKQSFYNYHNLSIIYFNAKKNDSAFVNIKKARGLINDTSNKELKRMITALEARFFLTQNDFNAALKKAQKALLYSKDKPFYLGQSQRLIAEIYIEMKELKKAENYALQSIKTAKKFNHKLNLIQAYNLLSVIYKQKDNTQKALYYKELEYELDNIILNENQKKNINLLNIKYESEKKDKELIQQQLQIEQKDKEIRKKKTQYNYMTGIAIFLLLATVFAWFLFQQRQKRKNQEIVSLKREHQIKTLESLIEGEEKERFRIAKELHDGVNGDLSAIKFKLSSLLDENNKVVKEAVAMIDKSYEQVRAISHNLIPPSLEDFELVETLDNFCHKIDDNQEINVTFQHVGDTFILPKKDEINIFRIVQELVSNSIKHAEATEINVQLSSQDNSLQITVDDNGKGFDKETVKGDGIGLENIQSRIEYLEATVDFSSNDRGTSYIIEIDLDKTV